MARDQVTVDVIGEESVIASLDGYGKKAEAAVQAVLTEYTKKVHATARELTEGEGSGKVYSRPWGTHQASSPGEPPAEDTGRLRATIRMALTRTASLIVGKVLAGGKMDVDYATALEFGVQGTDGIEARPFLRPALEEHIEDFIQDLKKAL